MASIYKVQKGQNIFDVAIQVYGSIEGLFDLLMTNDISINDTLEEGQRLSFHEEFVRNGNMLRELAKDSIIVRHGNGNAIPYHTIKNTQYVLKINAVYAPGRSMFYGFNVSGSAIFYVDWGDGQQDTASVDGQSIFIGHEYKKPGVYSVKVYGVDGVIRDLYSNYDNVIVFYILSKHKPFIVGVSAVGGPDVII